jgi:hypothetical protein
MADINVTEEIIDINVTEEVVNIIAPSGGYPLPNTINSVFGRVGNIVATEGDYTLTQLGDVTLTSPANGQVLKYNGTSWVNDSDAGVTGTGTTNTLPKFTGASTIGNSNVSDSGTLITLGSNSSINGQLVIGGSIEAGFNLIVNKTITGGVNAIGVYQKGIVQSDVTGVGFGFNNQLGTQATTFTISQYRHYSTNQQTLGAGSSIGTQIGFQADNTLTSATNNYGFRGLIPSGAGRWNLYMDGTAANYLAGDTAIGTTTLGTATQLTIGGTETAVSAIGRGQLINTTLVASANSDVLVGLDIAPTFTTGGFTGVTNAAIRHSGDVIPLSSNSFSLGSIATPYATVFTRVIRDITQISYRSDVQGWFNNANTQVARLFGTTGNFTLQNGGTFTDAGFRLDVNGTTRFIGTASTDSPPLGSELLTTSNWTSTGWTGDFTTGFTHTTGNTSVLSNTLAAVIGTYYKIQITMTGRTAGSITIGFGGDTRSISSTRSFEPIATTTGNLTITPTSDFNGTIIVSVRTIGLASPNVTISPSTGSGQITMRATNVNNNTVIGLEAGQRLSSSGAGDDGTNNTFIGYRAGRNSTQVRYNTFIGAAAGELTVTGTNNTAVGRNALYSNTTGLENTALGEGAGLNNNAFWNVYLGQSAGFNNTTGNNNIFLGRNAGRFITGGSIANTVTNDSIFIGQNTKAAGNSQFNQIVIGFDVTGLGNNTTVIGNSFTTTTALYGDLLLGTTTPSTATMLTVSGTETASSAIARGGLINTTLVASANNDVLVGLDIQPTFTNGAFTGVANAAIRIGNYSAAGGSNPSNIDLGASFSSTAGQNLKLKLFNTNTDRSSLYGFGVSAQSLDYFSGGGNHSFYSNIGATLYMRLFGNGNLLLQNGGTFTDAGFRLDVNGTARVQGSGTFTGGVTATNYQASGVESLRSYSDNAYISFFNTANTTRNGYIQVQANRMVLTAEGAGSFIQFNAGGEVERMRITSGGNVLINTTTDVASSKLTVNSTTQGFLPPRMTTTQKLAIGTPASGLMVYDTTLNQMSYFNGTIWINF